MGKRNNRYFNWSKKLSKKFIFHNGEKIIKEILVVNEDSAEAEINASNPEAYQVLEVDVDFDAKAHKIVDGMPVLKDNLDKYLEREKIYTQYLKFSGNETDQEVDQKISEFFFGGIKDISAWKMENYDFLRKFFYPPIEEHIDAQVKIASSNLGTKQEGQVQLSNYLQKCQKVKDRFSKKNKEVK
jgi:hypothetical protein